MDDRVEKMKAIRDELLINDKLPLYGYRVENKYFPVAGEGNHYAEIIFIGEAPGKNEAMTGKPFCGAAGRVLDECLKEAGIERQDVYITNIVKDRPQENRDPFPEEIEAYAPYLDRQIETMRPKIIATLGRFSMDYIMRRYGLDEQIRSITAIRGKIFETDIFGNKTLVVPLYHPAATIYDQSKRAILKADIKMISDLVKK